MTMCDRLLTMFSAFGCDPIDDALLHRSNDGIICIAAAAAVAAGQTGKPHTTSFGYCTHKTKKKTFQNFGVTNRYMPTYIFRNSVIIK